MTVILSLTPTLGISSMAHLTMSLVADRPSRRAFIAISQAARGFSTALIGRCGVGKVI